MLATMSCIYGVTTTEYYSPRYIVLVVAHGPLSGELELLAIDSHKVSFYCYSMIECICTKQLKLVIVGMARMHSAIHTNYLLSKHQKYT